jgi:hypothetical protein
MNCCLQAGHLPDQRGFCGLPGFLKLRRAIAMLPLENKFNPPHTGRVALQYII